DLVAGATNQGLHLRVGYRYNCNPDGERAREIGHGGQLGNLVAVRVTHATAVDALYRGRPGDYEIPEPFGGHPPQASTYADPAKGGGHAHTQLTHVAGILMRVTGMGVREVAACVR